MRMGIPHRKADRKSAPAYKSKNQLSYDNCYSETRNSGYGESNARL